MRSKALVLGLVLSALAAGCSHAGNHRAVAPSPTPSPSASPTLSPTPAVRADPLTGLALGQGPVVAVKVDNAPLARPYQTGLRQASVVYQELVEGGLTRLMAVFESPGATHEVGPVRSGRESDLDILRAYGRIPLGFSGAQPGVLALIKAAERAGRVIDASRDSAPGLYRAGVQRRDARNYFVVPARLGARHGGSQPVDVGLRFGALVSAEVATSAANASFSPASLVRVRYNAATGRYVLSQGGRVVPVSPTNVIVQVVRTHPSRFHDVHGVNTPLTISTGSGRAYVLRDGKRVAAVWKRTGFGATRFTDYSSGDDVMLKPGQTWIFLLPQTGSISFG